MKNLIQKVISEISGYEPTGEQGAGNDYYYSKQDIDVKIIMIKNVSYYVFDTKLNDYGARRCMAFLDADFNGEDEAFHAYKEFNLENI